MTWAARLWLQLEASACRRHRRCCPAAAVLPPSAALLDLCLTRSSTPPQYVVLLQAIRDHSRILMGKNTMMRRSIRLYCERTGNDQWLQLLDHMVGNVGLIFTKGDLNEVRTRHRRRSALEAPDRGAGRAGGSSRWGSRAALEAADRGAGRAGSRRQAGSRVKCCSTAAAGGGLAAAALWDCGQRCNSQALCASAPAAR